MNSIPEEISDQEFLFRGIHRNHWHPEENRPTTATFKTSIGCSVDRDAMGIQEFERTEEECIDALIERLRPKAVLKISAEQCRAAGCHPKSEPDLPTNPYHCHIQQSPDQVQIKKRRIGEELLIRSSLVYKDPM